MCVQFFSFTAFSLPARSILTGCFLLQRKSRTNLLNAHLHASCLGEKKCSEKRLSTAGGTRKNVHSAEYGCVHFRKVHIQQKKLRETGRCPHRRFYCISFNIILHQLFYPSAIYIHIDQINACMRIQIWLHENVWWIWASVHFGEVIYHEGTEKKCPQSRIRRCPHSRGSFLAKVARGDRDVSTMRRCPL